jgi:hypothetical protein
MSRLPAAAAPGYRVLLIEGQHVLTDKGAVVISPVAHHDEPAADRATLAAVRDAVVAFPALHEVANELLQACLRARIALRFHGLLGPAELIDESIAKALRAGLSSPSVGR